MRDIKETVKEHLSATGDSLDSLKNALSLLLSEQFILRQKEKHYETYELIRRNEKLIADIFEFMNLRLTHNGNYNYYYIISQDDRVRERLNRLETVLLLIIRLLYEEYMTDLKVVGGIAAVTNREILEKYRAFINAEKVPTGSPYKTALATLKRFNLIDCDGALSTDTDFMIKILPTVISVMDKTGTEELRQKLADFKKKGVTEGE